MSDKQRRGGLRLGSGRPRYTFQLAPETADLLRTVRDAWRAFHPAYSTFTEEMVLKELIEREARAQEFAATIRAATEQPH